MKIKTIGMGLAVGAVLTIGTRAAVIVQAGSLRDYAKTLRDQSLDDTDMNKYQAATVQERADFAAMATQVAAGNLNAADGFAAALGYEVVNFTDTDTNQNFHLLREVVSGGKVTKGWGSYFYNPAATKQVLVQAPHIRHDTHSYDVATIAFRESGAAAMMFNGAHRDSGGNNVADVAHLTHSIFNTVHQTWSTGNAFQAWQIHGFNLENSDHNLIPAGTDVVLSNGDGSVSEEIKNLGVEFEAVSYIGDAQSIAHAYNTLPIDDPDNVAVNGNVLGTRMASLGGTTNVQGIYTRGQGGIFVHIELEQSIRLDGTLAEDLTNRETAGVAIANAIKAVPEPSSLLLIGIGGGFLLCVRRKK